MSEPRIALIAEGITDFILIEAALGAILPSSFVLKLIQPEATRPKMGQGWSGVLKWCHDFHQRSANSLDNDPTLELFDMVIIHLDADVAEKQYADCGETVVQWAADRGWGALPCSSPCPPAADTVRQLESVLHSWLGRADTGNKGILCVPSTSTDTWLAMALALNDALLAEQLFQGDEFECEANMAGKLATLPKAKRVKKSRRDYLPHAATLQWRWDEVCQSCGQADQFQERIRAAGL